MEVDNAFFKNITHYRYLLKGPIDVMGYWLFFVQRYVCMALYGALFLRKRYDVMGALKKALWRYKVPPSLSPS